MTVRVRIAPTPSGKLHLGTAHTALFNYLFSKHHKGKFILRIDDSDPKRCKKEYEKDILTSLKWLGVNWDEGPDIGGPYGPYRQSERMDNYWPYVEKLLKKKKAYFCYCTPKELAIERQRMEKAGKAPRYSGKCRHLSKKQIDNYKKEGRKPAVRLKVAKRKVSFVDPARERITVDAADFGDFIIARGDKTALLGLATTIDDIQMKITHTIRGEDYLNFVPRQILIYEALGFEPPVFAHLPFVYAPDGSKLSKRHGATAVSDYQKMGYLPEAVFNYLTLLGWSVGDDREVLSKEETIKIFNLKRVNTNPYRFDFNKLKWINGVYIRKTSDAKLLQLVKQYASCQPACRQGRLPVASCQKIIPLLKERITKLSEIDELVKFFIKMPDYNKKLFKGTRVKEELKEILKILTLSTDWKTKKIYKKVKELCQKGAYNKKEFYVNLYIAIEGKGKGLPVFESMEILGKKEVLSRLNKALEKC